MTIYTDIRLTSFRSSVSLALAECDHRMLISNATIDSYTGECLTIDYPHVNGDKIPSSLEAHEAAESRDRILPPMQGHNYLPEELRQGLKPIDITQPEGVSFKFEGRTLVWQNWRVHVGFNYREGMVLSNITYDDGKNGTRPLFYRLSVAEMVVPVGFNGATTALPRD
jgi:primary-amine oxidase